MINGMIKAMFDGYKEAKKNKPYHDNWEYEALLKTPYLHSSDYLSSLYEEAQTGDQVDCIIDHMNRHGVWKIDNYKRIEAKIIDERWSK